MIDTDHEQLIPLKDVARMFRSPRTDSPLHISTVHRWVRQGVRGVKLETVRVGGLRVTSRAAVSRFIQLCSANDEQPQAETDRRTPEREKRTDAILGDRGLSGGASE